MTEPPLAYKIKIPTLFRFIKEEIKIKASTLDDVYFVFRFSLSFHMVYCTAVVIMCVHVDFDLVCASSLVLVSEQQQQHSLISHERTPIKK